MKTTTKTTKQRTSKIRRSGFLFALVPFVLVAIGARGLAPRISEAITDGMLTAASWARVRTVERDPAHNTDALPAVDPPSSVVPRAPMPRLAVKKTAAQKAIVISREQVLRLTSKELRRIQTTTFVDGHGRHSGVSLIGMTGLGVGLADGDVVTSIDGRPTPTENDATDAVLAAWNSGTYVVHASIVRGGDTIAVTLEIPRDDETIGKVVGSTKAKSGGM